MRVPAQGVEPRSPRSERGLLPVRRSRNGRTLDTARAPAVSRGMRPAASHARPARSSSRRGASRAARRSRDRNGGSRSCEQLGIADELCPASAVPILLGQSAVVSLADPAGMPTVQPDDLAAASAAPQKPRLCVHPPTDGRSTQQASTARVGHGRVLCLVRPRPNDVFHATRLPFGPGSPATGCAHDAMVAVLRGGALEPDPRALLWKRAG